MLRWRLFSATIIIAIMLGGVVLDYQLPLWGVPGVWLMPICLFAAFAGCNEVVSIIKHRIPLRVTWPAYVGTLAVVTTACLPLIWKLLTGEAYPADCPLGPFGWPLAAAAAAVIGVFVVEIFQFREPGQSINQVAGCIFPIAYIGLNMTFMIGLRSYGGHQTGMVALVSFIFVTKISDAGAYTFGRLFGRTKLAPALSPGKTIEGSLGGIVTSCLGSILFFLYLVPWLFGASVTHGNIWTFAFYGVIVALAGMIGDLAESVIKRSVDAKDSGRLLPGHGGVLDRIDGLLFASPVLYYLKAYFL